MVQCLFIGTVHYIFSFRCALFLQVHVDLGSTAVATPGALICRISATASVTAATVKTRMIAVRRLGQLSHYWRRQPIKCCLPVHLLLILLSPRLVQSSGFAAMVIDGFSPSFSVICHLFFQPHHFQVSIHSIHPSCPRSYTFSFSGWFLTIIACKHVLVVVL